MYKKWEGGGQGHVTMQMIIWRKKVIRAKKGGWNLEIRVSASQEKSTAARKNNYSKNYECRSLVYRP